MARLTINDISDQGIANIAGAILREAIGAYINAIRMYKLTPDKRTRQVLQERREYLLTTPWNFTGLTGEEFLNKIHKEWRISA